MRAGKKILVVDQDPLLRRLASNTLRTIQYDVFEATGGEEGLRLARQILPDLILLDSQTSGGGGREIWQQLKSQPETASVPILVLGESSDLASAAACLSKPFSPSELLSRVQEYLHNSQEADGPLLGQLDREGLLEYARALTRSCREDTRRSQELNAANRRLRELERMKDVFLSIVSHELRTPLTVIKGHLHLLRRLIGRAGGDATLLQSVEDAQGASLRLERLVEELLDFSGMRSGVLEFKPTRHSVTRILAHLRAEMEPLARRRDCQLDFRLPAQDLMVEADPKRLWEALTHVVRNAILFNRQSGTVFVDAWADEDGAVTLRIRDTGCGIPPEDEARVLDPFYQTGNVLTRRSEGLGLGLSVARHIVEAHGGRLDLASHLGEGTTVTLVLPAKVVQRPGQDTELEATPPVPDATDAGELVRYAQELHAAFETERVRRKHLEELNRELEHTFIETLATLVSMVDLRGSHASSHLARVSFYARAVARRLDPELPGRRDFVYSLLLYDVGKIGVAESLLQKVEQLSAEEIQMVRAHTEIGANLLGSIRYLEPAIAGVRNHHERWDGTGYPDGLAGEDIPMVARIIAVADSFDAMTVDRPYRGALSPAEARDEIVKNSGSQFDPGVVEAFLGAWDEIMAFRSSLAG